MNFKTGSGSNSNQSQVKYGAILSYALIILNTVYGLVISPYTLTMLGESSYGVYKTIASFSASLLVLDLGIGTTVMRYTAKYRAEKKENEIGNFAAMGLVEGAIMAVVLLVVSIVIYSLLDSMFGRTFTTSELQLAKSIFIILIINMMGTIIENVLNGVITGMNEFIFSNGYKLFMLFLRMVLLIIVLRIWHSAIALVSISLGITVVNIAIDYIYILKKLSIHIKLKHWEKDLFIESLGYTSLMFIQTIAIQANGNIDNIVIGAVIGSTAVAVYSFGIQMFNMYESLATAFSNLMLPTISVKIANNATDAELQSTVTKVGRVQFMILGAALAGFTVLGKEFIALWLGQGFEDVYSLSLIMMVPVTFTLIENVCLSILRARNLMKFRTLSLIVTAAFNAIVTIIGTYLWDYYAAAIGTGLSIVVGSIIMMNIYYHKKIGFKVIKFYADVLSRLVICILVPAIIVAVIARFYSGSWISFIIKAGIYVAIYVGLLLAYGMRPEEKEVFGYRLRKGNER